VGQYLELAGEFFNAQITIGEQKWAGNVEIHQVIGLVCASSQKDAAYENVILHVVWEHDEIFRKTMSKFLF
jgi:hypothetical protein